MVRSSLPPRLPGEIARAKNDEPGVNGDGKVPSRRRGQTTSQVGNHGSVTSGAICYLGGMGGRDSQASAPARTPSYLRTEFRSLLGYPNALSEISLQAERLKRDAPRRGSQPSPETASPTAEEIDVRVSLDLLGGFLDLSSYSMERGSIRSRRVVLASLLRVKAFCLSSLLLSVTSLAQSDSYPHNAGQRTPSKTMLIAVLSPLTSCFRANVGGQMWGQNVGTKMW